MAVTTLDSDASQPARASLLYDPVIRGIVFQVLLALLILYLVVSGIANAAANLANAGIASGFGFLGERAGFDIGQTLIPYTSDSSYQRAFFVGLLNTIFVAAIGIACATVLGFIVGIARLSKNFLVRKVASVYVETLRNIPLLLQLLFWYKAVLSTLPAPRGSLELFNASVLLNNRGLIIPQWLPEAGAGIVYASIAIGIGAAIVIARWAKRRQMATGQAFPTIRMALGLVIGLPLVVLFLMGTPFTPQYPELKGFNFVGGSTLRPEFMALLLGLSLYTAAFIAEIVRAGILAVSKGQTEAAYSLGIRPNTTMRLVIIPQALRVIIPPLTSQYLNLTKNSSLAIAVGYPDLVSVFSGTVANQTGQAVEVISITMLVYLSLSLLTSAFMNWFNSRVALVER
ncbi:amino acid ABC transporter permease [Pararhizobium haloflavum]|uniref:amino acid ABC transporter permease n=1 Tax=Pararhizobium haloflavum TaxID=2037914 RepID=UPI000C191815|nr:amino acid ABC transporter permease [Pararhizobium haloflavum]